MGWRSTFYLTAVLGLLWIGLWVWLRSSGLYRRRLVLWWSVWGGGIGTWWRLLWCTVWGLLRWRLGCMRLRYIFRGCCMWGREGWGICCGFRRLGGRRGICSGGELRTSSTDAWCGAAFGVVCGVLCGGVCDCAGSVGGSVCVAGGGDDGDLLCGDVRRGRVCGAVAFGWDECAAEGELRVSCGGCDLLVGGGDGGVDSAAGTLLRFEAV